MTKIKALWAQYRRQIIGWIVILSTVITLWIFRNFLPGLASVLWPIVVGGALIGFRHELSELLKRLKRVGKEGMEFGENRIAAQIVALPTEQGLKNVAPDETHPEYITQRVEALCHELNSRQPDDPVKRECLLMLRLAEAQQYLDFYHTWMNLFSSQIEALNAMAAENNAVDLTPFYELHVARANSISTEENKITVISFEAWNAFFGRTGIAAVINKSGSITPQGRGLLQFSVALNLPKFQIL